MPADNEEPVEDPIEEPVEECGNNCNSNNKAVVQESGFDSIDNLWKNIENARFYLVHRQRANEVANTMRSQCERTARNHGLTEKFVEDILKHVEACATTLMNKGYVYVGSRDDSAFFVPRDWVYLKNEDGYALALELNFSTYTFATGNNQRVEITTRPYSYNGKDTLNSSNVLDVVREKDSLGVNESFTQEDDETLTQSMEEEPVEAGNGDLPVETAEEDDPIATGIANSIIAKYKRVSECGNTTTPTDGKTIVQEDESENGENPVPEAEDPTEPDVVEEADKVPTEKTMPDGSVNSVPMPMSQPTKDLIKESNSIVEEGFLSKKPKKLKPIGRDVVAYITCEMNDIHSANDQAMLAGYTCSKIELVDWYITVLDTNDPKYLVPHTRQYLVTMKAQLESLLAQILKIRPINRSEQIWRVNYPSYN